VELKTDVRPEGKHTVLSVAGEIDVHTAPSLGAQLARLVEDGDRWLVVDLTAVDFLDSTGLGVLVAGLSRCQEEGGGLSLVCTRPSMVKLFTITGLDQVLDLHPTVAEAVA
jgi:anti-sigma B factor antagonist